MVSRRVAATAVVGLLCFCLPAMADRREAAPGYPWCVGNKKDGYKVCLYLFVHGDCDGCKNASLFVKDLQKRLPWVKVVTFDLYQPANDELFQTMAANQNKSAEWCPSF